MAKLNDSLMHSLPGLDNGFGELFYFPSFRYNDPMKTLPKIIVILGPTASGKTRLAVELARALNGEIVSADSRQVYKGMDLGTGKDLAEYGEGENAVPYHLIDVAAPMEQYDLKSYQEAAYKAIDGILSQGKLPILVGGSGLYLQAVVDGYALAAAPKAGDSSDPEPRSLTELQERLGEGFLARLNPSDRSNPRRLERYLAIKQQSDALHDELHGPSQPRYQCLVLGLELPIDEIRSKIRVRLEQRFQEGMIDEVEQLHENGVEWPRLEAFGLEYKFIARYLKQEQAGRSGDEALEDMKERLALASGQFAKRQLSWFKRWQKQGREINWIAPDDTKKARELIRDFLASEE